MRRANNGYHRNKQKRCIEQRHGNVAKALRNNWDAVFSGIVAAIGLGFVCRHSSQYRREDTIELQVN